MDTNVGRVLRLFRLSVPPVFFLLACYVFLGEHVFGLAYVVGRRLKPRMRATLRGLYRLSTASIALVVHLYLLFACGSEASAVPARALRRAPLPHHHVGERALLRRDAARGAVGQPACSSSTSPRAARALCAAIGLMLTWITIADQQLCAHLLLLLFTARRTLALFPAVDKAYALAIKLYTMIHMSRTLTQQCDAIPKLAVATVAAMAVL